MTTPPHPKLFIPGPVEVSPETMEAFSRPMVGHRSKDFQALYASVQPKLQAVFHTTQPCYVSTSSAWGMMEGAVRNLVGKKVLNCMSGAFSDKWFDVSKKNGKPALDYREEWGQPIRPEKIDAHLATGEFDAVTVIHNETSTGTMNPLEEIAAVVAKYPDVTLIVDCVSSFTVVPIKPQELGIDLLLAGTQKALALPAGGCVFTVSERAFEKAATLEGRGYYFDLLEFRKNGEKNMTPTTPSISHFYALDYQLGQMLAEGLDNRYARHRATNQMVRDWARERGFELFPVAGYESRSLTCVRNNLGVDVAALQKRLREEHQIVLDGGYGKIKGETFRVSNMGDETEASIGHLLSCLDQCLPAVAAA
ncbi:MAG: alanine--glyoxylate aminotransferase family protein [Verrucomicrobiota bacterium]